MQKRRKPKKIHTGRFIYDPTNFAPSTPIIPEESAIDEESSKLVVEYTQSP
jgi:hypothetical protein